MARKLKKRTIVFTVEIRIECKKKHLQTIAEAYAPRLKINQGAYTAAWGRYTIETNTEATKWELTDG